MMALRRAWREGELKMADRTKRFNTTGSRTARRRPRKYWSRRFLELAGSAPDFPYPPDPKSIEPEAEGGKRLS